METLHQIGNCESNLGNHKIAAELYIEAARIFDFVGMEEYLSNALGELGYSLLEVDHPELLDKLDEGLVDHGLVDLANDTKRAFDPARPLNHQQCVGAIRKLFGIVILLSLRGHGNKLADFCAELANATVVAITDQVGAETRDREELFPIMMVGYGAGACVAGDLDAATLLDHVGEIAGENFARLAERHRRIRAELLLEALLISPLLRHPVRCDASGHRLHD